MAVTRMAVTRMAVTLVVVTRSLMTARMTSGYKDSILKRKFIADGCSDSSSDQMVKDSDERTELMIRCDFYRNFNHILYSNK